MPLLEVLEDKNAVLAKAYSTTQTPICILNPISSQKR